MTEATLVHHDVGALLAAVGVRYTRGRRAIVDALAGTGRPVTVEELLADSPGLPISSVYRNLAVLEAAGAVDRVATGDDRARVELAQALVGHHHHLVCDRCGRVEDHRLSDAQEEWLHRELAAVAAAAGYEACAHRVDIVGLCGTCAATA